MNNKKFFFTVIFLCAFLFVTIFITVIKFLNLNKDLPINSVNTLDILNDFNIKSEPTYYIDVNGNDDNDGSLNSPFKTLSAALQSIKENNFDKNFNDTIYVYIKEGTYFFDKSLLLSKNENPKDVNIVFKSYKNDKVYFTGSTNLQYESFSKLTDEAIINKLPNKALADNILVYDLSNFNLNYNIDTDNILDAPELFLNDNPMTLSRYPNKDFATINLVNNGTSFFYNDDKVKNWSTAKNYFVQGYLRHDYLDNIVKVESYNSNSNNNLITLSSDYTYGLENNARFYVFNLLEELDFENEYYIDYYNKLLYFMPSSNEAFDKIQISLLNEPLININDCNNITIEGITFETTRSAAINTLNSSNISIKNCTFRNLGDKAVILNGGNNNLVSNCEIYNTGTGGIYAESGDRNTLTTSNNLITNNNIHNFSRLKRTYTPAIGVNGVGTTISNNTIYDAPHTAILFGGNDHIIEKNEIYDVAKETNDVGAIYSGRDWSYRGNIIRYNSIHDIGYNSNFDLTVGIYLDDCMSSANIYGNTIDKVKMAMHIGGGRDNIITENSISNCKESIVFDDRGLDWANLSPLKSNLEKVPYSSDIWRKKYPEIETLIDNNNPGLPFGNIINKNKLLNTPEMKIAAAVIENGTVSK